MAGNLIVRLIMDATGYLKTVDTAVASNTKLESSIAGVGETASISARKQVQSSLNATKALEGQIAGYRALAADATQTAEVQARAALLAERAQLRLNASQGISATAIAGSSKAAATAERDFGKLTRGVIAGSGAASSLGRSLAFASTGFIAVAGGATLLAESIKASVDLAKTQRQVEAQLKTSGKSWDQYGARINDADLKLSHLSGFTNQELLQGFNYLLRGNNNVAESLKLTAVAADVARGRNISLAAASIALAKAQGGSLTALRRLGITIPTTIKGMDALNYVQRKFAGQAEAGATVGDKFHAVLVDTEETIGGELLPTFSRLTTEITDWLAKMNETGRLQRDVSEGLGILGTLFHTAEGVIHGVDEVTGGLNNTLKILFEIWLGRELVKGVLALDRLAGRWAAVALSANAATAAEERAVAAGAGAGAAGVASGAGAAAGNVGLLGLLAGRRAAAARAEAQGSAAAVSRISKFTGAALPAEEGVAGIGAAAAASTVEVGALTTALGVLGAIAVAPIVIPIILNINSRLRGPFQGALSKVLGEQGGKIATDIALPFHDAKSLIPGVAEYRIANDIFGFESKATKEMLDQEKVTQALITKNLLAGSRRGVYTPPQFRPAGRLGQAAAFPTGRPRTGPTPFDFGVTPIAVYSKYSQTITEQIASAQAALTKTTRDDVKVAKSIIARIKRLIDHGHLAGSSLVQALQDEASQQSVLDNARQAAAQQAKRIAEAKKAAASSYSTPIDLQLAEARAQLTASTADDIRVERQILAAAKRAIASGKKNKQGQLAALQVELQAKQALESLTSQSATTFTIPLRLQLALARAQALGQDQTKILLKEKAALERALKASKGNIQKQIDIYNQIAAINEQLGASTQNAYGDYKKASLKAETAGLGLTAAQRRLLEARLSQRGPGGTVPKSGTGAGGFIIGPDGRPVDRHRRRDPDQGRGASGGAGGGRTRLHATFNIRIYMDNKDVTRQVTIRQQQTRDRNPSQRRGPHAGKTTA